MKVPYSGLERMAESRGVIERLRRDSEAFEELCSDYEICIQYIDKLNRRVITDLDQQREYRELCYCLELEIMGYLRSRNRA